MLCCNTKCVLAVREARRVKASGCTLPSNIFVFEFCEFWAFKMNSTNNLNEKRKFPGESFLQSTLSTAFSVRSYNISIPITLAEYSLAVSFQTIIQTSILSCQSERSSRRTMHCEPQFCTICSPCGTLLQAATVHIISHRRTNFLKNENS